MVYVFLADGFEEIEAFATVDILRRAGIEVNTVAIKRCGKNVSGTHGITMTADIDKKAIKDDFDMIVLPGGMPGTRNLENSEAVQNAIDAAVKNGRIIAAICAAPSILGHKGILKGKKAVCYPGFESDLLGAQVMNTPVCEDGNIITANGPGAAIEFGFTLAKRLGADADEVKKGMLWRF